MRTPTPIRAISEIGGLVNHELHEFYELRRVWSFISAISEIRGSTNPTSP